MFKNTTTFLNIWLLSELSSGSGRKKNPNPKTKHFATSTEDYCYHTALFYPMLTK